jgi:hypothetical protein
MSELDPKGNGFTQKEMLVMVLKNQEEFDKKLDDLKKELSGKVSKMELMGYLLMAATILMIATNWQMLTG